METWQEKFRKYVRPFINAPYGEEQREIDIDAIIQYLEEIKPMQ